MQGCGSARAAAVAACSLLPPLLCALQEWVDQMGYKDLVTFRSSDGRGGTVCESHESSAEEHATAWLASRLAWQASKPRQELARRLPLHPITLAP